MLLPHGSFAISDADAGSAIAAFTYGYDNAGQLTSNSSTNAGVTTAYTYGYDTVAQLSSVDATPAGGTTTTSSVAATPAGLVTTDAAGSTLAYNSKQELTGSTPISGPASGYSYDGNGSRTSSTVAATPTATTTYAYSANGQLKSVATPTGTVSYTSDGNGLRQSRTAGGVTKQFTWSTAGRLPQLLDDGQNSYIYGPGNSLLAQVDDTTGATQYLSSDNIGSTRVITATDGTVAGTADYDPYGNALARTGTATSSIGYSGNWTDPLTGLVYLRARDYDPATAQFLSVDPAVDSTNQPYAYADNRPTDANDPTGLICWFGTIGVASGQCQDASIVSGIWDFAAKHFDPVYPLVTGIARGIQDAKAGCPLGEIGGDAWQAFSGAVGIAAIVLGGAGEGAVNDAATDAGDVSASTPVGRPGSPLDVPRGTNSPATVNGIQFTGHALDEMQSDGLVPSVVQDTIENGQSAPSRGGTTVRYSPQNNLSVVLSSDGRVVTVSKGDLR